MERAAKPSLKPQLDSFSRGQNHERRAERAISQAQRHMITSLKGLLQISEIFLTKHSRGKTREKSYIWHELDLYTL